MTTSKTIAGLIGPTLVALAAGMLLNIGSFRALAERVSRDPALIIDIRLEATTRSTIRNSSNMRKPIPSSVSRRRIQSLPEKDSEMTERISLEGKVAVVTGAGRGLGRAYVEHLAERGARVVVNDLGTDVSGFGKDATIAEQVADLIRSRGGEAIADDSDVSRPEGGSDLIATTIEHFGRIDLLVNNAGICGSQLFEEPPLTISITIGGCTSAGRLTR